MSPLSPRVTFSFPVTEGLSMACWSIGIWMCAALLLLSCACDHQRLFAICAAVASVHVGRVHVKVLPEVVCEGQGTETLVLNVVPTRAGLCKLPRPRVQLQGAEVCSLVLLFYFLQ